MFDPTKEAENQLIENIQRSWEQREYRRSARAAQIQRRHGADAPRGKLLAINMEEARDTRQRERLLDREMVAEATATMAGVYAPMPEDSFFGDNVVFHHGGGSYIP